MPSRSAKQKSAAKEAVRTIIPLPSKGAASVSPAIIEALTSMQRQRQFCIVSQHRIDRAGESFLARAMGFSADMAPADRKGIYARAAAFRKSVEKNGESEAEAGLKDCVPIIINSAASRRCWDRHRAVLEGEMQRLAQSLPVWMWANEVRGLSAQGLACIVGEAGDLAGYETKERVWKRLGLAVVNGVAQQRRSDPQQAVMHGFSPRRRAVTWSIADVLLRHQWRGVKDDRPAHAIGPYGAVYGRRKAHTVNRDGWTAKHRDNDARRVMTKALIEDLWRVWNGKEPLAGKDRA